LPLAALGADESSLDLDLRFVASRTQDDALQQSLLYEAPVYPWLDLFAGLRFSEASQIVDTLSYMGQADIKLLPFAHLSARLLQVNYFNDTTASTVLVGKLDLQGEILSGFGLYGSGGYYKLFAQLTKSLPVPTFTSISFTDYDFVVAAGFWVQPTQSWMARLGIGTFDEVDVYNLANPFAQVRLEYLSPDHDWVFHVFGRYQLLLGFGRSDTLTVGAGVRFPL
jgi:hypothetical protein